MNFEDTIWNPLSRLISTHIVIARKDLNIRKRRGGSWKIGFFYHVKCQDRISKQIIEKKLLPLFGADRFWSWFLYVQKFWLLCTGSSCLMRISLLRFFKLSLKFGFCDFTAYLFCYCIHKIKILLMQFLANANFSRSQK